MSENEFWVRMLLRPMQDGDKRLTSVRILAAPERSFPGEKVLVQAFARALRRCKLKEFNIEQADEELGKPDPIHDALFDKASPHKVFRFTIKNLGQNHRVHVEVRRSQDEVIFGEEVAVKA